MATTHAKPTSAYDRTPDHGAARPSRFADALFGNQEEYRRIRMGRIMGGVWSVFLIYPLIDLFQRQIAWWERGLLLLGLAAFFALWFTIAIMRVPFGKPITPGRWLAITALYLLAVGLTIAGGPAWVGILYYFESAVGWLRPRIALCFIGLCAATVLILGLVNHDNALGLSANILQTVLIGFLIISMFSMVRANAELRAAREELARLAVAEERLRFARDLHDLLGHSLSLITLKSELAGRLATVAPERATSEIRDIEQVARKALREVREAVAGYRQPTLRAEIAGARTLLTAAGIACTAQDVPDDLPTSVDALFAWAVREGVTNIMRHSHAHRGAISFARSADTASVTLTDDGTGPDPARDAMPRIGGSGLAGLAERVAAAGGTLEVGPVPAGGYRLHVTAPLRAPEESTLPADTLEATA